MDEVARVAAMLERWEREGFFGNETIPSNVIELPVVREDEDEKGPDND